MHHHIRITGLFSLIATMLIAAACSGTSGVDALDPIETAEAVATETDEGPEGDDTLDSSTTAPAATEQSVDEADTTSTALTADGKPELEIPSEWDSDLDEIFGRYLLYWEALDIAAGPPSADPNYPALEQFAGDTALSDLQNQLRGLKENEQVLIEPPDSAADHGVRLPNQAALGKTEGNEVIIQDCHIQDWLLQSNAGETVSTFYQAVLWNVTMRVIDGEWRVFANVEASPESDGYEECQQQFESLTS